MTLWKAGRGAGDPSLESGQRLCYQPAGRRCLFWASVSSSLKRENWNILLTFKSQLRDPMFSPRCLIYRSNQGITSRFPRLKYTHYLKREKWPVGRGFRERRELFIYSVYFSKRFICSTGCHHDTGKFREYIGGGRERLRPPS